MQDRDTLAYETVDATSKHIISKGSVDLDGNTIETMIYRLKNSQALIEENGSVNFFRKYQTWNLDDKEVSLLYGENDLIWDVFCNATKNNSFFSFKKNTIVSPRCHTATLQLIEKLKNESYENTLSVLRDLKNEFKVVRVYNKEFIINERKKIIDEKNHTIYINNLKSTGYNACIALGSLAVLGTSIATTVFAAPILLTLAFVAPSMVPHHRLSVSDCNCRDKVLEDKIESTPLQEQLFIEIEPKITASSYIDSRVTLNKFTWAVTLVTYKGSFGNHAEIVIEGINDGFFDNQSPSIGNASHLKIGEKFIHLSHFQPRIDSGLISADDLKYETRTEIWMITCEKVKQMIHNIETEKTLLKGQRYEYNDSGEGYVDGLKAHNCFTWAQLHLKSLGIEFKEKNQLSVSGFIASCATDYTYDKEHELYHD